jgi:hypothetical protein
VNDVTTPKFPPPPRSAPEEIRVLLLRSGDERAVGEDDVGRQQTVDGQAVPAGQMAVAAAQRQTADAGRRHDAGRHGQTEGVRGVVQVAELTAASHLRGRGLRVDAHPAHRRQVQREPAVDQAQARPAVPAAAHREVRPGVLREGERGPHVPDVDAPGHGGRTPVDHGVVHGARLVVPRVPGREHRSSQCRAQAFQRRSVVAAHVEHP